MPDYGPDGKRNYYKGEETDRKEAFATEYMRTRSAKGAYVHAYTAQNMSDTSIRVAANKMKKDPFVQRRVDEMQAELAEKTKLSLADIINMLLEDRLKAHEEGQAAAAVQASAHVAKILGYYIDNRRYIITNDFDNMGIEELRAYVQDKAQVLGIAAPDAQRQIEHNPGEFEEES